MSYIKPEQFFTIYSGEVVDEIRRHITEALSLQISDIEWIGWRPRAAGKRAHVTLITKQGKEHQFGTSIVAPIIYHASTNTQEDE